MSTYLYWQKYIFQNFMECSGKKFFYARNEKATRRTVSARRVYGRFAIFLVENVRLSGAELPVKPAFYWLEYKLTDLEVLVVAGFES